MAVDALLWGSAGWRDSYHIGGCRVRLFQGDIAAVPAEALVNAANSRLWMGGGVAGAIKRAGGSEIEREAMSLGPRPCGDAVVTGAGRLSARYVIHAVTMAPGRHADAALVRRATGNALLRCAELGVKSVAFPALGTGSGGLAIATAARAMLDALRHHVSRHHCPSEVILVHLALEPLLAFAAILDSLCPPLPG